MATTVTGPAPRATRALTWGLFAAWLVHDLEEVATMRADSRRVLARVPAAVPLPDGWREGGLPQRHVNVAVALMGTVVAAASVHGHRTGGRSGPYQSALLAFGVHGFGHVALSLAARRYTTGVVTSPTVVIPFWLWARHRLRAEGVPATASPRAVAATVPLLWTTHALAYLLTRRARGRRGDLSVPSGRV
ncbi:MAG: HXXEE domain-containing protein [Actinobacteria bacterium]|nr:HXXEE domain-containing protein [Actinomycetota bacterium]